MLEDDELKGLGGWLVLVGFGLVFAPFYLSFELYRSFAPVFEDGVWQAVTTVGSEFYIPYLGTVLVGEVIINCAMIAMWIYLAFLFFTKNYLFPKLYIGLSIFVIVFVPLDAWVVSFVLPDEPMFDKETLVALGRSLVGGIIWISYMLVSERVKNTFVKKEIKSNSDEEAIERLTLK